MSKVQYTDDELRRYFSDRDARHVRGGNGAPPRRGPRRPDRPKRGFSGFFHRRFRNPAAAQAATVLSIIAGLALIAVLSLGIFALFLTDDLPTFEQLRNPGLQFATIAYTADNQELARYAYRNRSWVTYDQISPAVINALIATEDKRFYEHWGIDVFRTFSAVIRTAFGDRQGGSTVSQQLARNLYNQEIGFDVTPTRKVKEMLTAVQLERQYTKREIIEMYLNTVEFGQNAFGIEAAARTFFNQTADELGPLQGATLVGMLQAITRYNPVRNPENARQRRNVVLNQMVKNGYLTRDFYEEHRDGPVVTDYNPSAEIASSLAPHFAEYVRLWTRDWARENGLNVYADGLRVYTTLDSRMQAAARESVEENMNGLQAVVNYEWGVRSPGRSTEMSWYLRQSGYEPFSYFWSSRRELMNTFIRETDHYRSLVREGASREEALTRLRGNEAFVDSLKRAKSRLEGGLVSIDPRNGHVKAWVGGRDFGVDKYDKVANAARQPGSTFKPFVYTAAIDNGWSPYYRLPDSTYTYRDPITRQVWQPRNSDFSETGQLMTLREALAMSKNTVSARVITQLVNPHQVAFYARRMGIESPLDEVPSLALGVSDVTLLELTSAYGTLASGGLHYDPTVVTRIEDRYGNVLFEAEPAPEEALSEETAYTVVDMLRGVIDHPAGTGQRIRWQYELRDLDLAGKTGTTQNSADGWFVMMHPQLVTGGWVGFNDSRIAFRTNWWGQGAHNALFLVGSFFRKIVDAPDVTIENVQFPRPEEFGVRFDEPDLPRMEEEESDRRVRW